MSAPVISDLGLVAIRLGSPATIALSASPTPDSWTAAPLPTGLSLVGAEITGTPTSPGYTTVYLTATASGDTGTGKLVIAVDAARARGPRGTARVTGDGRPKYGFTGLSSAQLRKRAESEAEAEDNAREGEEGKELDPPIARWPAMPFDPNWFD